MISKTRITTTMRNALINTSINYNIPVTDLRIKIKLENDEAVAVALNKISMVKPLEWKEIVGIQKRDILGVVEIVKNSIKEKLIRLAELNQFTQEGINIRVYSKDSNGSPSLYVYHKGKPIKELDIEEII